MLTWRQLIVSFRNQGDNTWHSSSCVFVNFGSRQNQLICSSCVRLRLPQSSMQRWGGVGNTRAENLEVSRQAYDQGPFLQSTNPKTDPNNHRPLKNKQAPLRMGGTMSHPSILPGVLINYVRMFHRSQFEDLARNSFLRYALQRIGDLATISESTLRYSA